VPTTRHFNKPLFIISFHVLLILNAVVLQGDSICFSNSGHQSSYPKSPPLCYTINNTLVSAHDNELGSKIAEQFPAKAPS